MRTEDPRPSRISNGQDLPPISTAAAALRGAVVTSRTPFSPKTGADHGAWAPADVAPTVRSSRAHGHATALMASHRHNQAMSHTSATVEPSQISPAVTAGKRQGVTRQQFLAFAHVSRVAEPRRETASKIVGLRARARYSAPAVGLPPWGLLLRYIAGGGGRSANNERKDFAGCAGA